MHRSELRVLLRALPIAIALISGGCGASVSAPPPDARTQLQQAISAADAAGRFRVRGQLTAGPAVVAWDGVVVGNDEQYRVDRWALSSTNAASPVSRGLVPPISPDLGPAFHPPKRSISACSSTAGWCRR